MIGKIKKGKSFAGLTKYILEKEQAELICTNLAGETPQDFYKQLCATQQLNPRVRSPVSHISISFPFHEKPENQELEEIVEETLLGMGFEKNLYFAASHNDCNHFHLHIAASRINIDGECVSDWYDKRRLEKVLRNLEIQFNLTPVPNSCEVDRTAPTTGQKRRMFRENQEFELGLRDKPADKSAAEKIQDAIETAIQPGMEFAQFVEKLKLADVETSLKFNSEGIIQGISYSTDGVAFAGSKLGRSSKASTLKGLTMRGIKFDHYRDDLALTRYVDKDNFQQDKALEPKINRTMRSKSSQIQLD
ncbi:relaxase/mobilization nuclease domain-containing protein [Rivularia sp. UHCC 0363]|uniref:relaxase/mobilization nuclease domain-containing protein n=1 Tax=Rivularia sp. UHCC 0363 TaxID=3110244 RepID=UPI002B1FAA67|nr:relaxase/mobilization nuclease domain-containing protein [Rivularia sp. UHCC 0363]MEA5599424.1 relaxase/mobilization nuclease domain-containing protein [Rivularia sp. UHCC 0363]